MNIKYAFNQIYYTNYFIHAQCIQRHRKDLKTINLCFPTNLVVSKIAFIIRQSTVNVLSNI